MDHTEIKRKTSHFDLVILLLIVGFSINFFEPKFLNSVVITYVRFVFLLGYIITSMRYVFRKGSGFQPAVRIIIFAIIISFVMASISWGQGYFDTLKASTEFIIWPLFFYFLNKRTPVPLIEKVVVIYGCLYVILYFFQLTHSSVVYFGYAEEFKLDRGVIRVNFPGAGVFFLTIYIAICKITTRARYRNFWLLLASLGIIITTLQVTRQTIFAVFLIYLYHFTKNVGLQYRILILSVFVVGIIVAINSDNPISRGLIKMQQETNREGKDNIRIVGSTYYLTSYSPNLVSRIFGNGIPYGTATKYGRFTTDLEELGFYFTDDGLVAFYVFFGIFAVLGFIIICVKSFTIKVPPKYSYVKYYIWTMLGTCLTSSSVYHSFFLITTILSLYIFQRIYEHNVLQQNEERNLLQRNPV